MPRKSKNQFQTVSDEIHIMREGWNRMAYTSFRDDYYDQLTSYTWTLDSHGYLVNGTLGPLHRYIMKKWYGKEIFDELTQKGYVVDHMNNEHTDCRISNLEFLKQAYNTAKGQAFDVDSKELRWQIAVNIFKDFSTGYYQITIGCNDTVVSTDETGQKYYVNAIILLYDCDYSIVINDAENILRVYETEGKILVSQTHSCDLKVIKAINIQLTDEEKNSAFVMHDGIPYVILGNGHTSIRAIHYEKGWVPHSNT